MIYIYFKLFINYYSIYIFVLLITSLFRLSLWILKKTFSKRNKNEIIVGLLYMMIYLISDIYSRITNKIKVDHQCM